MLLLSGYSAVGAVNPIGPETSKYSFEAKTEEPAKAVYLSASTHFQNAEILPLPFSSESSSIFSTSLNRNHFLLVCIVLSLGLLVLAHKNHFETDIYEFYHRNQNGMVTFESMEAQRAHFMRASLAKILRLSGILCAAAAVFSIIFG